MALAVLHWVRLPAVQSQVQAVAHLQVQRSVVLVVPWWALQPTITMAAATALTKTAMANAIARRAAAINFCIKLEKRQAGNSGLFVFEITNLRAALSDLSSAALSPQSLARIISM
jgi:hypothetical protein